MSPSEDEAVAGSAAERRKYYGLGAIRRSFVHFVLGKGLSAVSSLVVLVMSIRHLAVAEFAAWASMHALVMVLGLVSSLGTNAVQLRFLPELRAAGNNRAMYRLLALGILLRAVLYIVAGLVVLSFADSLGTMLKLDDLPWLLSWYLVVGFLRINATFAIGSLESLLWQREAQYSLAVAHLTKLVAVVWIVYYGTLDLATFVLIEGCTEFMALALMLGSAFWRWLTDPARSQGDPRVLIKDRQRYVRFGLWTYAQNLTSILNGSAPNRLLIGYFLPVGTIALFGAVDRLISYIRRYEPLLMFLGMVRPIFNARFTQPGDFPGLVGLANLIFRANLIVLLVPFILFALAGESLFDWLTAGKYAEAAGIFLAFYGVLIIGSVNPMLDVLIKVIEQNRIYTITNLVLSASLCIALPLLPHIGLWALVVANGGGLVLAIAILMIYLRRIDYGLTVDWALIMRIIAFTSASVALGHALLRLGAPLGLSLVAGYGVFFTTLYCWPPLRPGEKVLIGRVLRRGGDRLAGVGGKADQ